MGRGSEAIGVITVPVGLHRTEKASSKIVHFWLLYTHTAPKRTRKT